jgi:AraC-like DNA-binding protein
VTYLYPRDATKPWRFFFVTFNGDAAVQMVRDLVRESGGVFEFPTTHPLLDKFASFLGEGRESAVISLADSWRLVMELLHALLIAQDQRHGGRESDHALIHRAHDLLRDAHGERINVSELASRLNVSREHLTRVFAEATGEPPYRFIMRMRLQRSCNLLKNTDLSVKEIATRMGFGSVSEFCRPFKRQLQLSPTEFRARGIMPVFDGGAIDFTDDVEE